MITRHPLTNFQDDTFNFILEFEGLVRRVYNDGVGVPTIGVGYALVLRDDETELWERRGVELIDDFAAIGITLSQTTLGLLDQVARILNSSTLTDQQKTDQVTALGITPPILEHNGPFPEESFDNSIANIALDISVISDQSARDLFNRELPREQAVLRTALGNFADSTVSVYDSLVDSRELLVLTSLFFNARSLIGPKLKAALQNQDRAEAWYEIRYNSNLDGKNFIATGIFPQNNVDAGHAKRRFGEAELFGLYNDPGNVSESDSKSSFRVITRHRDYITQYEAAYGVTPSGAAGSRGNQIGAANAMDIVVGGTALAVGVLEAELTPAANFLRDTYITNVGLFTIVDWQNIYVGEDATTAWFKQSNPAWTEHDILTGSNLNDLIFGESGRDELIGNAGNDVLYGGADADVLVGGPGNDYLDGGAGKDNYRYFAPSLDYPGDGHDTIRDEDNRGQIVYFDDTNTAHILSGARQLALGSTTYQGSDPSVSYTWDKTANTLTITLDGIEAITVLDYVRTDPAGVERFAFDIVLEDLGGAQLMALTPVRAEPEWQNVIFGDATGQANDVIIADPVTTEIAGLLGDDTLEGRSGQDGYVADIQLFGGPGNDILVGESLNVLEFISVGGLAQFEANRGAKVLLGIGAQAFGGPGNDIFQGSLRDDFFDGGEDHDFADSYLGDDTLIGGRGNDTMPMLDSGMGRTVTQSIHGIQKLNIVRRRFDKHSRARER